MKLNRLTGFLFAFIPLCLTLNAECALGKSAWKNEDLHLRGKVEEYFKDMY